MISVVVPVYNVEKYLYTCINSIQSQTYEDVEIILVDDGSQDSSGQICDEIAEKDTRIRVIHKENGGLSDARNAGLSVAKGEFICFIDSDDWIEPDTFERAIDAIDGVSVVIWGYYKDTVDAEENVLVSTRHVSNAICDHKNGYHHLLEKNVLEQTGYAWNKLYRMSIIQNNNMQFEKGLSLVEDVVFNFPLFINCDKIRFINYLGSHYIQRPRITLGTAYYPNRLEMKLRVADLTKTLLLAYGAPEDIAQIHYSQNISTMLRSAIRIVASGNDSYMERRNSMKELLFSENCKKILTIARPKDLKNKIVLLVSRIKFIDLLLILGRRS